ncbi:hypothetical protein [Cryobacterium sp. PH29-G1]|uniref:SCO7613 C-terminal domain-containing membrane protein n=1 Tax=Cryobacterium sp. PH29-G1 TaxID=3046211 RepID=UPI0024B8A0D6|nr:hypothetical protein [Cryobacterium sp. PH29-G1]MDJ0350269.1 hypothetical protein [Cryobacterium sp. PH29-G1]
MSELETGPSGQFYLRHVGRIIWPRTTLELTDTTLCPACHTPLKSAVCSACQLDLRNPAATELLNRSAEAAAALERRAELIGRIRYETKTGRITTPPVVAAAPHPVQPATLPIRPAAMSVPVPTPTPAAPNAAIPTTPSLAAAHAVPAVPTRPQRSSVQVVLLSIGVLLVSVAAIFFLTVAWIIAGLAFRSFVVALLTVAALLVAARIRRSRLTSTAEGIGSFAVVLVLLDVWGMRSNNLFGLAAGDAAIYWGIALLACAALFLGWHVQSKLRVGSIAGFVVAVPGFGLLAAGLLQNQDSLTRVFVGFLGAAIGALLHRVTFPRPAVVASRWPAIDRVPERMLLVLLGAVTLVTSAILAFFVDSDSLVAPIWCLGAVAVVATAHVVIGLRAPQNARLMAEYRYFAFAAASLAAFSAAGIAPVIAGRFDSVPFSVTVPLLVAATLAVALESFGRRSGGLSPVRTAWLLGAGSAAIVAAIPLLLTVSSAVWPLTHATANGLRGREVVGQLASADNGWALLALVGVGAILLIGWTFGALLHQRRQIVTALALAVVVLAVPFVESIELIVTLYLLLGAGALITLLLARTSATFSLAFLTPAVVGLLIAGETLGYLISWANPTTWWFGTVSLVLALWCARLVVTRRPAIPASLGRTHARGALVGAAIVITLVGVAHVPLALAPDQLGSDSLNVANVTAALALATALLHLLVAAAALRPTLLTQLERRWAFFTLLIPTIVVFALPVRRWVLSDDDFLLQPEPFGSILRTSLIIAACSLWVFVRANRGELHWERAIAATALAPALILLAREVLLATDAVASVFTIAAPALALVICSLALFRGTGSDLFARRDRMALELGAVIVLAPAVFTALVTLRSLGWLVIVLAGIVALIMAIAPDGLFGSGSNRRHFGWLALLLGTVGLWLGLDRAGTVALEPYVLPVAGVVLVTALLIRRYGQSDRASAASPVAGLLVLAGLLTALVPLALVSQTGSLVRPAIVALVSAALLLGTGVVRWSPPRSHYLSAAGLAGAVALVITVVAQTQRLRGTPGAPDARIELWLLLSATVGLATAFLLARQADAASASLRRGASITLVLAWASVVTVIELAVVLSPVDAGLSTPRAVLLVLGLSALHVIALWRQQAPLGPLTAWSVLALAGLAAFSTVSFGVVAPFELVTVPVALALLGSGWLRLNTDARARSWRWLGVGLVLLLGPSLLQDLTYNELWRIVGLGIAAIVVLVIGSTRRLQAPFVIGAAVLLIHGIAQLWPWISLAYSVIPWFLWLGAGGILLIVLAARYEQRIANLKSVALRITALR